MATYSGTVRRGLPRVKGGEPWPAAGDAPAPVDEVTLVDELRPVAEPVEASPAPSAAPAAAAELAQVAGSGPVEASPARTVDRAVRRGLPRIPGGEPWPPAREVPAASTPAPAQVSPAHAPDPATRPEATPEPAPAPAAQVAAVAASPAVTRSDAPPEPAAGSGIALRRGLPRTPGGEPWPPAGYAPVAEAAEVAVRDTASTAVAGVPEASGPLPFTPTVFLTPNAAAWNADRVARQGTPPLAAPEPVRHGPFTTLQWVGATIVGGLGLLFAAGMLVLAVRWFLSLGFMQDFLTTYPGEYHLPDAAPVGIPAWIGWQHFFNVFLMVLIIRSGLRIRNEKRPTAFWTPRGDPKGKVSLTIWFHQSLDVLWLVNGAIFVVLLFVTGQWMRIVPTSWEVFPNALSGALQYVSLDWPTENGWVNYNALQQLAYFATVFLAAPLAAATGARMSKFWPQNAKGLNKAYPIEWARAVHFPTMLYFVLFIFVHVVLVFATGALRNLNHMYAAQGSTDPTAYADNWVGFWIFVASLVVIAAGWVAARPLVIAPIARLFGTVTGR